MSKTDKNKVKKCPCDNCRERSFCKQIGKPEFHIIKINNQTLASVRPLSHPEYFNGPYH
jgi:hypothetical protein